MNVRRQKVARRSSTQPNLSFENDEETHESYVSGLLSGIVQKNSLLMKCLEKTQKLTELLVTTPNLHTGSSVCSLVKDRLSGFMLIANINDMLAESLETHGGKRFRKWLYKWSKGVLRPNKQGFCTWGREAALTVTMLLLRNFSVTANVEQAVDELKRHFSQDALNKFLDSLDDDQFLVDCAFWK